ncbi:MAG TPA: hypothetical protein VIH85_27270, partial [Solirubrobacteraceae bacterium]
MPHGSQTPSRMNRYDAERRMPHLLVAGQTADTGAHARVTGRAKERPAPGRGSLRSGGFILEEEHAASKN